MNSDFLIALLALVGTIFGSLIGAFSTNKLLNYRIQLLEDKVNRLNEIFERVAVVEQKINNISKCINDNFE